VWKPKFFHRGGVPFRKRRTAMSKSKTGNGLILSLLSFDLYKRNQGRLTRQLTALALLLVLLYGAWTLSQGPLSAYAPKSGDSSTTAMWKTGVQIGIPTAICVFGAWFIFRLVNYSRFADFLISVEAEMDKVSWSSRDELFRATAVVLITMVFLAFILLAYDIFWRWFFTLIRFLQMDA
jgi:preprotein translocase subunit SecE